MSLPGDIENQIESFRRDNTHGASALTLEACRIVLSFLAIPIAATASEFMPRLVQLCKMLAYAQPTMAPLINLANSILKESRRQGHPHIRDAIGELTRTFANQVEASTGRIAFHALRLFDDCSLFLTHSHSSAVKTTFLNAHDSGRRFSVYCTESRPMREGVDLALELARHGIAVNLLADVAAFSMLSEVRCVLVGADSVSLRGVVNKVGTRGIALAAQAAEIPVCVLCGSEKFIPERLVFTETQKDPRELLQESPSNLRVHNIYYDVTPLDCVSTIITEEGSISISRLRKDLTELEENFVLELTDLIPRS